MHVAAQHPRRVFDRLPATELRVFRDERYGLGAELVNAHFEGEPGASGGFLENHGNGLSAERFGVVRRAAQRP